MSGAVIGALRVVLGLDRAEFTGGLTAAQKELKSAGKSMQAMGAGFARVGAGLTATVTAPLIALGFQASKAANEAKDAMGQVTAALKSMGNQAGQTKDSLADMATGIMRNSLYDDDDILRKVTANLLTFGKIANDEFRRAQIAAADLATRMDGDLQAATILVGKALNDPVRGMGALRKAGVQLDESQQKLVKSMVATGNVAGAQRILLGELEAQFGGAAKAAQDTDPYDSLRDSLNDLSESMGAMINTYIKPLIDGAAGLAGSFNALSPEVQKFALIGTVIAAATGPALIAIGGIVGALGTLAVAFAEGGVLVGLGAFAAAAVPFVAAAAAIAGAIYLFRDDLAPVFEEFKKAVMDAVGPALTGLMSSAKAAFAALGPAVSAVVSVVGPLLAGLSTLFLQAFGPIVITALRVLVVGITNAFEIIAGSLKVLTALFHGDWAGAWNAAGEVAMSVVRGIGRIIEAVFPGITENVRKMVQEVTRWLTGALGRSFEWVKNKAQEVGDAFFKLYDRVVGHSYIPDMVDEIGQHMARLQQALVEPAQTATRTAAEAFADMRTEANEVLRSLLTDQERLWLEHQKRREALIRMINKGGATADLYRSGLATEDQNYRRDSAGIDADGLTQPNIPELGSLDDLPGMKVLQDTWASIQNQIRQSREDFADAFEYGINAALRGDWRGVLQAIFGDLMSNGLKSFGRSLFEQLGGSKPGGLSLGNIGAGISSLFKKIPGFANGGSILPGGAGGIDSQLVQFRKSPGERVDIYKPGNDAGPGGGAYQLMVNPSPYFDVRVEKIATPIATQSGIASAQYSRAKTVDDLSRRQTYTRGRN